MKIILPFKKDVLLKDNIYEITSISLENQLSLNEFLVQGTLYITGEYRVSESSNSVLPFNLELPVSIALEDKYITKEAKCDIDDFYYEIVNNQKLAISVDISIDKLKEKELKNMDRNIGVIDDRCIDVDDVSDEDIFEDFEDKNEDIKDKEDKIEIENNLDEVQKIDTSNNSINSLFDNLDNTETYKSYLIYIIRENDTIDNILSKYDTDIDIIKEYNDISDLKVGDKIIIPSK